MTADLRAAIDFAETEALRTRPSSPPREAAVPTSPAAVSHP
jgi:hypothetical protein